MPTGLRIFLIIGSLLTAAYVLGRIRKSKMSMESSVFWILFSMVLVVLGIFPDIAEWFARSLGIISPVNLVYLVIIFLLLVKVFVQDQRIARLEGQAKNLTQAFALRGMEEEKEKKEAAAHVGSEVSGCAE